MTGKLPDLHAGMLDRVVAAVRDDPRFDALLASGSLVTGGFDEQSDLDLILVVRAEMQAAVMAERRLDALEIAPAGRAAQWFEDRTWLWLHYSATKMQRGEYFEALSGLDFFRDVVLGPMLRRNTGERPRGLRRIEGNPGARDRLLPTLAAYDRAAIAEALRRTIALYMELRAADPPPAPTAHMPQALLDYIDERQ